MTSFLSPADLDAAVGAHLGYSNWVDITQERVNQFAEATNDHQWIHVDPDLAAQGPFGGTIGHGYLTLSLAVPLVAEILEVGGVSMGINYGTNKVRFITPVPVGGRLRLGAVLASVEDFDGGRQVALDLTFEIEGKERPACVAQVIYRFY